MSLSFWLWNTVLSSGTFAHWHTNTPQEHKKESCAVVGLSDHIHALLKFTSELGTTEKQSISSIFLAELRSLVEKFSTLEHRIVFAKCGRNVFYGSMWRRGVSHTKSWACYQCSKSTQKSGHDDRKRGEYFFFVRPHVTFFLVVKYSFIERNFCPLTYQHSTGT